MSWIKTKIRKFLWFDITPRHELYDELNLVYLTSNQRASKILELEGTIDDKDKRIVELAEKITETRNQVTELLKENHRLDMSVSRLTNELTILEENNQELKRIIEEYEGAADSGNRVY